MGAPRKTPYLARMRLLLLLSCLLLIGCGEKRTKGVESNENGAVALEDSKVHSLAGKSKAEAISPAGRILGYWVRDLEKIAEAKQAAGASEEQIRQWINRLRNNEILLQFADSGKVIRYDLPHSGKDGSYAILAGNDEDSSIKIKVEVGTRSIAFRLKGDTLQSIPRDAFPEAIIIFSRINNGDAERLIDSTSAENFKRTGAKRAVPSSPKEAPQPKPPVAETKPEVISDELLAAVKKGDGTAVNRQLADDANIAGVDENGATVLHHAALKGRHEIIGILLKAGGNVNAQMRNNNTPLHMAIFGGAKRDTLRALLEGGADVNAKGSNGMLPLDAVEYGRSRSSNWRDETIELLRKRGGKTKEELKDLSAPIKKLNSTADRALFGAVMRNNVEAAKKALANGADVNARGIMATENTPLIHAATAGAKEIVELLIANGAEMNARYQGKTALLHTATYHKEIVELLIANGAEANAKVESGLFKGKTALDLVIKFKESETADLLRKHGGKTAAELKDGAK